MSRFLLSASLFVLLLGFAPAPSYAQNNNAQNNGPAEYNNFANDFLYGSEEEEEDDDKPEVQWQYDNKYKKGQQPDTGKKDDEEEEKKLTNILPSGTQKLIFVRKADTKPNEVVLRMMTPLSIDGCASIVPPVVSQRKNGPMITYKIEDPTIALDQLTQYYHFQCDNRSNTASADITINRDDLLSGKVKTMTFQGITGMMDIYDVTVTQEKIAMVPRTNGAFQPITNSSKVDPLSYTFYPENVVILYAPSSPRGSDLTTEIAALAQSKGLVESTVIGPKGYYFIDQSGALAGSLDFNANAYVGKVKAQETFQGANGSYQVDKVVDVYAKRPGMMD
jgi:hypothetical protein